MTAAVAAVAGTSAARTRDWVLAPRVTLQWRQLDEVDWVVFEPGAGQMHALDPLAAAVLTLVEAGSGDEPRLLAELRSHWPGREGAAEADEALDAPASAALRPLLDQTLQALAQAGLIAARTAGAAPAATRTVTAGSDAAAVVGTHLLATGPAPATGALPPPAP